MARIAGVNIPDRKHIVIGLQSIFGIGATRAKKFFLLQGLRVTVRLWI